MPKSKPMGAVRRGSAGRAGSGVVLVLAVVSASCFQYRQQALGVTPANGCPDFARGCSEVRWAFAWGLAHTDSPPEDCGDRGLAEVTVRDNPLFVLLTIATVGIVSAKRVEWKCGAPDPKEGVFGAAAGAAADADTTRGGEGWPCRS